MTVLVRPLPLVFSIASAVLLASCDACTPSSKRLHAVGTYIGGGSMLFGSSDCTYEGGPGVFQGGEKPSSAPEKGPRFVNAPGRIIEKCKDVTFEYEAVAPTAAVISGPAKIKRGATSDRFSANLVANDKELEGRGNIEWILSQDCQGIATFDAVLGSQDTGGPDRTRALIPAGPGKCTIIATITTGSALQESFPTKAFQAEFLVTVE